MSARLRLLPGEPEQDRRCGATRRKQIGRDEVDGLDLHTSCPGTGRAVPRPDMGREVSAARKGIAAASDPFRHKMDHGGVADYPCGQLSLCLALGRAVCVPRVVL